VLSAASVVAGLETKKGDCSISSGIVAFL